MKTASFAKDMKKELVFNRILVFKVTHYINIRFS